LVYGQIIPQKIRLIRGERTPLLREKRKWTMGIGAIWAIVFAPTNHGMPSRRVNISTLRGSKEVHLLLITTIAYHLITSFSKEEARRTRDVPQPLSNIWLFYVMDIAFWGIIK
jgi:hypothetical protein